MAAHPWTMIGWSKDFFAPTRGPTPVTVRGRDYVVFPNRQRTSLVAAPRRCPHRGADLALGTVGPDCVRCAYHRRDVSASLHLDVDVDASGVAWIDDVSGPDAEAVTAPPPPLPEWTDPAYSTFEYSRRVEAAADVMMENLLDWDHVDSVHAFAVVRGKKPRTTVSRPYHGHAVARYEYPDDGLVLENAFWGPFTSLLRFVHPSWGTLVLWTSITPIDAEQRCVDVHFRVSKSGAWRFVPDALLTMANDFVLDEDRAVVRGIPSEFPGKTDDKDAFVRLWRRSIRSSSHWQ